MRITDELSDLAILSEFGRRVARRRVSARMTQSRVAKEAGISKRTVERIENGSSAQFSSLIRLLRALDLVGGLEHLVPEEGPSPMELLRTRGKRRVRASGKQVPSKTGDWAWEDDHS